MQGCSELGLVGLCGIASLMLRFKLLLHGVAKPTKYLVGNRVKGLIATSLEVSGIQWSLISLRIASSWARRAASSSSVTAP